MFEQLMKQLQLAQGGGGGPASPYAFNPQDYMSQLTGRATPQLQPVQQTQPQPTPAGMDKPPAAEGGPMKLGMTNLAPTSLSPFAPQSLLSQMPAGAGLNLSPVQLGPQPAAPQVGGPQVQITNRQWRPRAQFGPTGYMGTTLEEPDQSGVEAAGLANMQGQMAAAGEQAKLQMAAQQQGSAQQAAAAMQAQKLGVDSNSELLRSLNAGIATQNAAGITGQAHVEGSRLQADAHRDAAKLNSDEHKQQATDAQNARHADLATRLGLDPTAYLPPDLAAQLAAAKARGQAAAPLATPGPDGKPIPSAAISPQQASDFLSRLSTMTPTELAGMPAAIRGGSYGDAAKITDALTRQAAIDTFHLQPPTDPQTGKPVDFGRFSAENLPPYAINGADGKPMFTYRVGPYSIAGAAKNRFLGGGVQYNQILTADGRTIDINGTDLRSPIGESVSPAPPEVRRQRAQNATMLLEGLRSGGAK